MTGPTEPSGDDRSPEPPKFRLPKAKRLIGIIGVALAIIAIISAMIVAQGSNASISFSNFFWLGIGFLLLVFLMTTGMILLLLFLGQKKKRKDHDAEEALRKKGTSSPPLSPQKKKRDWGWLVVLLVIAAVIISIICFGNYIERHGGKQPPVVHVHAGFVPRQICPVTKLQAYADRDLASVHDVIMIDLVEGCYADWYTVPQYWDAYEVQLSQGTGDYASLWCNDHENPYAVVEPYQRGVLRQEMYGCHAPGQLTNEFHFQGHGTITLIMLTRRRVIPVNGEGFALHNSDN
jgi:hypothetical protein